MDPSHPIQAGQRLGRIPECSHCRYELTGFSVGDVCPECGEQIKDLYPELEYSRLACAAAVCGALSLCTLVIAANGPYLLIFGFLGFAWTGVVLAMVARRSIRRAPFRCAGGSMAIARCGFWMSAPGVIIPAAGLGVEVLRPFVYG